MIILFFFWIFLLPKLKALAGLTLLICFLGSVGKKCTQLINKTLPLKVRGRIILKFSHDWKKTM